MNCRDTEPLLFAETDGVLPPDQRAALERHLAACPACQEMRTRLQDATAAFRADAAQVSVPDANEEWQTLRAQLAKTKPRPEKKRPLAPVIWFGTSLAAAAALTVAYLGLQPKPADLIAPAPVVARSNLPDANAADAPTVAYVDQESGWLVVWAADGTAKTSG
ncbi:MAG: hypothetical protein JWQ62_3006 [Lacunisphaera sp.]|nr:hypothetical protein [Lacunisphaera sp.]